MTWDKARVREINRVYRSGDLDEFTRMLRETPEYLRTREGGDRWLRKAAQHGNLDFLQALIELGLDVNEPEYPPDDDLHEPEGPIALAATFGHLEMVEWLLANGAEINFELNGERRCIPLVSAATNGHLEIVKLLVEHGADVHATYNGVNAIGQAKTYGKTEVYEYLTSLDAEE